MDPKITDLPCISQGLRRQTFVVHRTATLAKKITAARTRYGKYRAQKMGPFTNRDRDVARLLKNQSGNVKLLVLEIRRNSSL
jgi:hypothetical protein